MSEYAHGPLCVTPNVCHRNTTVLQNLFQSERPIVPIIAIPALAGRE